MKKEISISILSVLSFLFLIISYPNYSSMESKRYQFLYYFYNHHYDLNYLAADADKSNSVLNRTEGQELHGSVFTITDVMISKMIRQGIASGKKNFVVSYCPNRDVDPGTVNFNASLLGQTVRIRVLSKTSYVMDDLTPDSSAVIRSTKITYLGNIHNWNVKQ